jgi:hypothetical protein
VEHIPSFKDFYPKALLPAAYYHHPKWERVLEDSGYDQVRVSHWLVAYEWKENGPHSGWLVLVYPADEAGRVLEFQPVFMNEVPIEFDAARILAARLENCDCTIYHTCRENHVI